MRDDEPLCFPMMLRIAGRTCVVVGAGAVALGKIHGLLAAGARVVVISPRAVRPVQELARAGRLLWRPVRFRPELLTGALLSIAATSSAATNESVYRASVERGILCNSVDDPPHCDFFYPAVVRRGALQIAVSTGGRSPALAARLRRDLESRFGEEWAEWVEHLGRARRRLLTASLPPAQRKRRLMDQATGEAFEAWRQSSRTSVPGGAAAARASKKQQPRERQPPKQQPK